MLKKTKGIALHYYNYSESSVIAKIFTQNFGLQSYIINGVRHRKAKSKLGYLQTLNTLDLEVYTKSKSGLKRIKEMRTTNILKKPPFDLSRKLVAIFIAEVLLKVLIEDKKETPIFTYLKRVISELQNSTKIANTYPLEFLLNLSSILGFYPSKENADLPFFDLQNGYFTRRSFGHPHFIKGRVLHNFKTLLLNKNSNLSHKEREELLTVLLDYYKLHHHELKNLTSHLIIQELRK